MITDINSEDRLVQRTFADHLENVLGWESVSTNQACCAVIPRSDRAHFIHAFLFFRENKEQLMSLSAGAAQNNISQQIIRAYEMLLPSRPLMDAFVDSLMPVFQQWLNLQRQDRKLRATRDLLLPRLMSGEI